MHRLWWYVGSRDIKMEQSKFGELLIMSVEGYPHVYDKSLHALAYFAFIPLLNDGIKL